MFEPPFSSAGERLEVVKVAVLFGGTSEERDVSIASAAHIIPALRDLGHEIFAHIASAAAMGKDTEKY